MCTVHGALGVFGYHDDGLDAQRVCTCWRQLEWPCQAGPGFTLLCWRELRVCFYTMVMVMVMIALVHS